MIIFGQNVSYLKQLCVYKNKHVSVRLCLSVSAFVYFNIKICFLMSLSVSVSVSASLFFCQLLTLSLSLSLSLSVSVCTVFVALSNCFSQSLSFSETFLWLSLIDQINTIFSQTDPFIQVTSAPKERHCNILEYLSGDCTQKLESVYSLGYCVQKALDTRAENRELIDKGWDRWRIGNG